MRNGKLVQGDEFIAIVRSQNASFVMVRWEPPREVGRKRLRIWTVEADALDQDFIFQHGRKQRIPANQILTRTGCRYEWRAGRWRLPELGSRGIAALRASDH